MKRVFRTAVFWPLAVVIALVLAHLTSLGLDAPHADAYTAVELTNFSRVLGSPLALPAAMASGVGAPPVTSSSPAIPWVSGALSAANDTALLGGAAPLNSLKPIGHGIRTYAVRRGDTLASVAERYGISTSTIALANPSVAEPLKAGAKLTIPPVSGVLYDVRPGDTLASIASVSGTDTALIKKYNADWEKIISAGTGTLVLPYASPTS